jgi:hypothetical protein
VLGAGSIGSTQISPDCREPLPAGFRPLDELNRKEPWLLPLRGSQTVRLDDGATATIRVEPGPCTGGDCERDRRSFEQDSFWITIDRPGREAARIHAWAPYGELDVIPQDLVGGPGDELLIVRIRGRASPPLGNEARIVQLEGREARELGIFQLGGNLVTQPVACARWRTRLAVDPDRPKPRELRLHTELYMMPCCRIDAESAAALERLRRGDRLRFDAKRRAYQHASD